MQQCLVFLAMGLVLGIGPQISQAGSIVFTANLNGPSESPPNNSQGTGIARVDFDIVAHTMRVRVSFKDLTGNTTVAHIHGPTSQPDIGTGNVVTLTPTFVDFPAGVKSGSYDRTFDTLLSSTYRVGFITASGGNTSLAEAALNSMLLEGKAYFNIHTASFPGGEIRGFLHPVPEPASLASLAIGAAGLLLGRRIVKRK